MSLIGRTQSHGFAGFLVGRDPDFQPAHHPLERRFLAADEQHVVQHQRLGDVGDVQHQPARAEHQPLEDVGDLLVELEVHGRIALEVAERAVVVQDLVGQDLPVVQPAGRRR